MKSRLFSGFSLTEVMLSMAIVGIIATITVPVVTNHYQKQSLLTLLQKNYVELDNNLTTLQTENIHGNLYTSILAKTKTDAGNFLKSYYKVKQDCGETAQPCFASAYSSINTPATMVNFSCNGYSVTVAGGAAICIVPATNRFVPIHRPFTPGGRTPVTGSSRPIGSNFPVVGGGVELRPTEYTRVQIPAIVYIDTNGPETPNISGRDLFRFFIYNDFTIDEVSPNLTDEDKATARNNFSETCLTSTNGSGCFSRIYANDWKMDY